VRIDAFDVGELVALEAADGVNRVRIVSRRQHDATAGMEPGRFPIHERRHAHDRTVLAEQFLDSGMGADGPVVTQQLGLECRDVRLGSRHDVVHPRHAVGRLRIRTVKA
jgi:hypothetical protein